MQTRSIFQASGRHQSFIGLYIINKIRGGIIIVVRKYLPSHEADLESTEGTYTKVERRHIYEGRRKRRLQKGQSCFLFQYPSTGYLLSSFSCKHATSFPQWVSFSNACFRFNNLQIFRSGSRIFFLGQKFALVTSCFTWLDVVLLTSAWQAESSGLLQGGVTSKDRVVQQPSEYSSQHRTAPINLKINISKLFIETTHIYTNSKVRTIPAEQQTTWHIHYIAHPTLPIIYYNIFISKTY